MLPIHTDRLLLRAHRLEDLDVLLDYYSNPEVTRYLPWEPWTRAQAEEHMKRRLTRTGITTRESALGLVIEREGQVIGDVVVWPADDTLERGELGWALHPSAVGHGYATEAVRALIDVAFGALGMRRLIAQLDPRNVASAKVCERLGMTKEAHLRQDWWGKGEWSDNAIYGLLAMEWKA